LVIFKKAGQNLTMDKFGIVGSSNEFKTVKFKLQNTVINPDTVFLAFTSSNVLGNKIIGGSTITYDDLHFIGGNVSPINNGELENWEFVKVEDPEDYYTFNRLVALGEEPSVTKTSDKVSGNYAIKIRSISSPNTGGSSGLISTSEFINSPGGVPVGFAYNGDPSNLTFDAKYIPETIDTATFFISFSKWNEGSQMSEPVGGLYYTIDTAVTSYTHFEIPISSLSKTPDSANVTIIAGNKQNFGNGTVLYLDNLGFDNKVSGFFNFSSTKNMKLDYRGNGQFAFTSIGLKSEKSSIEIYDLSGKLVYSNNFTNPRLENFVVIFGKSNLSKGIYTYRIQNDNDVKADKVFIY